jgi:hypothetical protein
VGEGTIVVLDVLKDVNEMCPTDHKNAFESGGSNLRVVTAGFDTR